MKVTSLVKNDTNGFVEISISHGPDSCLKKVNQRKPGCLFTEAALPHCLEVVCPSRYHMISLYISYDAVSPCITYNSNRSLLFFSALCPTI